MEDAVLLVLDFSSTDGGSASSMSRIRSHFTQLVRTQHSCSEKTASAESVTLDSYLQYCEIAQPSSSVKVETLLSLLKGPDMSQQFTSLKGLPLEMQSNALTWTMEEATTISVTNEKVVRCAVLVVSLPQPPPLLMGTPLQKIQFEIGSPEYDNLAVRLTIQWSSEWEHQFNLTPLFDLSQRTCLFQLPARY